jgi:hypothetical protein
MAINGTGLINYYYKTRGVRVNELYPIKYKYHIAYHNINIL